MEPPIRCKVTAGRPLPHLDRSPALKLAQTQLHLAIRQVVGAERAQHSWVGSLLVRTADNEAVYTQPQLLLGT